MTERQKLTQDIPAAETKAEGQKLEWGINFPGLDWYQAREKVVELNSNLVEGERKWRLPTKDELLAEFNITNSQPAGFEYVYYWASNTSGNHHTGCAVEMHFGKVYGVDRFSPNISTRLVRDAV